jgi:prolipoprotein diacylglyceryltransferase
MLFLISFFLHGLGGRAEYNEDQLLHGQPAVSFCGYFGTSRFWFESFQNWQSEFLAIAAMVILTIWLRQKGSPESKPVDAPHSETGGG